MRITLLYLFLSFSFCFHFVYNLPSQLVRSLSYRSTCVFLCVCVGCIFIYDIAFAFVTTKVQIKIHIIYLQLVEDFLSHCRICCGFSFEIIYRISTWVLFFLFNALLFISFLLLFYTLDETQRSFVIICNTITNIELLGIFTSTFNGLFDYN